MNYYQRKCDGVVHTIKKGDTLYKLSRIYGVPLDDIMDANSEVNVYNLPIGGTLCIPLPETQVPGGNMGTPGMEPLMGMEQSAAMEQSAGVEESAAVEPDMTTEQVNLPQGTSRDWMVIQPYIVKHGDTIESILRAFSMDFDTFASFNPQLVPVPIRGGDTIYVKRSRVVMSEDA